MNKSRFLIILTTLLLMGCEPMMFGMPESQFQSLTPAQQQKIIQGYNRQKEIEAQNAPLNALVDVAGSVVQQQRTRSRTTTREHCYMEGNTQVCKTRSSGSSFGVGFG